MTQTTCVLTDTQKEPEKSEEAKLRLSKGFPLAATDYSEADRKRFWKYVDIKAPNECWNWIGFKTRLGYGRLEIYRNNPRYVSPHGAHRISYALFHGTLPAGMHVCHRCDNPSCVNPAHLFIGTAKDNVRDMVAKKRNHVAIGQDRWQSKLNDKQVMAIRAETRLSHGELARKYGVTRGAIWGIIRRVTWKHLP